MACSRVFSLRLSVTSLCVRRASTAPSPVEVVIDDSSDDPGLTHPHALTPHTPSHSVAPGDQRFLKVAVIGTPNAGKSTLVNQLIGRKVFAVSPKRHTTLQRAMGVITEGNTQVVMLDTPGLIPYHEGRRLNVSKQFLTDPARSTMEADTILVIVDVANKYTRERLDRNIVQLLQAHRHIPSALALNKVDLINHKHTLLSLAEGLTGTMERQDKKHQIFALRKKLRNKNLSEEVRVKFESIIKKLSLELGVSLDGSDPPSSPDFHGNNSGDLCHSWPHFDETFMISSLTGDGIDSLKGYLMGRAPCGEWQYSSEELTDTPSLDLVENIVREKLFKYLRKEIPYVITQNNVVWDYTDEGTLVIYQNINCKTEKQASIVIGPAGKTIQSITAEASEDIKTLLNCTVDLTLYVRCNKK